MYSEGVLFLLITNEIEHLQAIGVSLSEQSRIQDKNLNNACVVFIVHKNKEKI